MADSPPRVPWKYAWSQDDVSTGGRSSRKALPAGAGEAASARLYSSNPRQHRTGRSAREAMQRELHSSSATKTPTTQMNAHSARLTADRYDNVMAKTAAGRARREIEAMDPRTKGDVYNYGDMLFQEAKLSRARKDEWRRDVARAASAKEERECTFAPVLHKTAARESWASSSDGPEDFLERNDRQHVERREKQQLLAEQIRSEEAKHFTFKPVMKNAKSKALTADYGDVLLEMRQREREREERLAALRERQVLLEKGSHHPDILASSASLDARARKAWGDDAEAQPAYERLYGKRTASYQQGFLKPASSDPECTFHPKVKGGGGGERAPRAHLEEVGDALHKDAQNRALRRAMLEAQYASELHELMGERKLSKRSGVLAIRKLNRDVLDIYAVLERTETGLTYEELGAALVELDLLKYSHAEGALTPEGLSSLPPHAREEVLMLQRMWKALVGFDDPTALLPHATLTRFLTRALAPGPPSPSHADSPAAADAPAKSAAGEAPSLDAQLEAGAAGSAPGSPLALTDAGGDAREAAAAAANARLRSICEEDPTLFSDFAAMYRSTICYKTTRNVKETAELAEAVEDANCTFAPKIDARSRQITAKAAAESSAGEGGRHTQLYEQHRALLDSRQRKRVKEAEVRMEGCTFKPSVNAKTSTSGPNGVLAGESTRHMGAQRFEHLYEQAVAEKAAPPTTEEREAALCTFKPELATKNYRPPKPSATIAPPGYVAAVERMRKVVEGREVDEAAEEARRRAAENARPAKPFSFQEKGGRPERKQPLLYMDVNLGPGRTGRIGLHEGDDPERLASNFAKTYQLDGAMKARLQALIVKHMSEVLPDLPQSPGGSPASKASTPASKASTPASKGGPSPPRPTGSPQRPAGSPEGGRKASPVGSPRA